MTHRRVLLAGILALTVGSVAAPPATAQTGRAHAPAGWVGTWEAAPAVGLTGLTDVGSGYSVRNVAHVSVGGGAVRLRLSNRFGTEPFTLGHVTVAAQAAGGDTPDAVAGTMRQVTFRGSRSAAVPAGADLSSDPVPLAVRADTNLLVTLYLPAVSGPVTTHPLAEQTSFFAKDGDRASEVSGAAYTGRTGRWYYLTGIDVVNPPVRGSVVTFGDSITDGAGSTAGANHRWPDHLADRLRALPPHRRLGVLNAGISGNRLLRDGGGFGVNALARLDEDVLSRTGVRTVIVLEGINDIQQTPHETDPTKIEGAYREIVARAHARGIRVVGATILPFKGWQVYDETLEATRQSVNEFIRTSGLFDAVIDFDAITRDPADPLRLLPAYDSGDHLHPGDAGYKAMAAAVDLDRL
jgi:lysophospholipase L1-like esterase